MREVILLANASEALPGFPFLVVIIFRLFVPVVARSIDGEDFSVSDFIDFYMFFALFAIEFYFHALNLYNLFMGLKHVARKATTVSAMKALISAMKDKDQAVSSLLPMINVVSYFNMRNWHKVRSCMMDVGKLFNDRI